MPNDKYIFPVLLCFLSAFFCGQVKSESFDAGFLYDDFGLTLASGHRTEIAGPAFYYEQKESQDQWAIPPLWSWTSDAIADFDEFDFCYPFLTYDRFGSEYRFQILQLFAFSGGRNQQENKQSRFTLFPLYFQQRSSNTELNYTALFPLYGTLKNRLFRDEIHFLMFPFYGQSRKRDVITDNYLYPIFHLRHGEQLAGWQVWPITGHEHKNPTFKTNLVDGFETIGGHDKWFAIWPFYLNSYTGIGTTNPVHEVSFLPAYSRLRSPARDSTTVLWPFFSHVDNHEKNYHEWQLPWPLVIFARGEGKTANRIWPLFSQVHNNLKESAFYLWPVYKYNRLHSDPLDRERTRILFYLYSDVVQKNTITGRNLRHANLWPLFNYCRDYTGDRRLQVFAPIEAFLPNNKSVERDWSPLWSIWRSEAKGDGSASSQSFLWNLYRRETALGAEKCSLLFGLFHYQSDAERWRFRLGYLPVLWGKKPATSPPASAEKIQPPSKTPANMVPRPEHRACEAADQIEMKGSDAPTQ